MTRELTIRALGLYLPIVVALALWAWRQSHARAMRTDTRRLAVATALACAWSAPPLLALNAIGLHVGWWTFDVSGGRIAGVPADLWIAWTVFWGAVPTLAFASLPLRYVLVIIASVDVIAMPWCEPVIVLSPTWMIGELLAVVLVLWPGQLLARWTMSGTHVKWRAALQVIAAFGWLVIITLATFHYTGGNGQVLFARDPRTTIALVQLVAVAMILGFSAVQEFALRGHGTPIPFDPPRRLVLTGPYAYVANPMQLSATICFAALALLLEHAWILLAAAMTVVYSAGIARWDEEHDLAVRFGNAWRLYRGQVSCWWPRWTPFLAPGADAKLYVAQSCPTCRGVGRWFIAREPQGLEIVAAETHRRGLRRITYEAPDGFTDEGVGAIARALEHINLGWALLGMFLRLPGIRTVFQLVVDASGGQPRVLTHRSARS